MFLCSIGRKDSQRSHAAARIAKKDTWMMVSVGREDILGAHVKSCHPNIFS